MKVKAILIGVGVVGVMLYKMFFVDSAEVRKFNDTLVDTVVSSDANFEPYFVFLDQYSNGEKVDVSLMTQAREELKATVEGDIKALKEITVPDDDLCKDFHQSSLSYLSNSADIVGKYEEQIAYVSQHNPGTEQDVAAADEVISELLAKDDQLFEAVAEIQAKMAKKFNFELEE